VPQTDLLFARSDCEDVVRFVLDLGATLVPSNLRTAEVTRISNLDDYCIHLDSMEKLFHIQHPSFERCPLDVRRADGKNHFYVMLRNGGPTVDFLGPYEFEEAGKTHIGCGFIGYYPTFWNTQTHANEPAPTEQKRFYEQVLRQIRSNTIRMKVGKRTFWASRSVAAGFHDGLIALPEGDSPPLPLPAKRWSKTGLKQS
jgi:hypothetical protein